MKKNFYVRAFFILLFLFSCKPKIEDSEKKQVYTVNFESNGGTKVDPIKIEDGNKVKVPADPRKDGYVFKGWYLDKEFKKSV